MARQVGRNDALATKKLHFANPLNCSFLLVAA
jgi:hypothetical protein